MDKFVVHSGEIIEFLYKGEGYPEFVVEDGGYLDFVYIGGNGDEEIDFNFSLFNEAKLRFLGVFIGKNDDKCSLGINVVHNGEKSKSDVVIKSALFDESVIKVNGNVFIPRYGDFSEASLIFSGLMLGDNASGGFTPSLEIVPNEVKASHKASLGKIDDDEMFYLLSRGIDEDSARKMIVEGFLVDGLNDELKNLIFNFI